MSFFGIGPTEMVVIAVVALVLFNPRELPKMLRSIAKFWGQLRATADEFKDTIMSADGVDELQEMVKGTKGQIRQVENDARRELMKARAEMRKAQQKLIKANQAKLQQKQQEIDAKKAADIEADAEAGQADASGDHPETPEPPEAPVAATPPHERKPAAADASSSDEGPSGDDPLPTKDDGGDGDDKDAHNQGAA